MIKNMILKVKHSEEPTLFNDICEFAIDSDRDHRRGSSFFREDIIEFKEEHKKFFPEVKDFESYIGFWRTNNVIWDDNYGFDSDFSELTRVEPIETVTIKWNEAKEKPFGGLN